MNEKNYYIKKFEESYSQSREAQLIQYLNHEGLRTEVYAFDGYLSHELKQRSDDWYLIDESWLRDR